MGVGAGDILILETMVLRCQARSIGARAISEQVACGADQIGSGLFDQGQLSALRHGKAAEAFLDEIAEILLRRAAAQKARSEEHTSELQSLMRISYAVFCL